MASMTWGGTDLPLPDKDGIDVNYQPVAVSRRMLSGALKVDYVGKKAVITVRWSGLTMTEYTQLMNIYDTHADVPAQLVLPDGQTFAQVIAVGDPVPARQLYDTKDTPYYQVTITFEEV